MVTTMPKFKRLPKSEKPAKFELEEDFTITPRFDREEWEDKKGLFYVKDSITSMTPHETVEDLKILEVVEGGKIKLFKGGRNNGLTCHRDHSWALSAAHGHDILLLEGYKYKNQLDKTQRAMADRVFLSVLLDHVDTLTGFKKHLYKFFAYSMYWAVRGKANIDSIIKG